MGYSVFDLLDSGYSYGLYRRTQVIIIFTVIALCLALVGTILSFIFITPEKKRDKLPKFFQIVHDIFNFKGLIIEKILKALYIFFTLYAILNSFFLLFSGANFFGCLLSMILLPLFIRIVFEFLIMTILLVKNTISINKKLGSNDDAASDFEFDYSKLNIKAEPKQPEAASTAPATPAAKICPGCGNAVTEGDNFCPACGTPINK